LKEEVHRETPGLAGTRPGSSLGVPAEPDPVPTTQTLREPTMFLFDRSILVPLVALALMSLLVVMDVLFEGGAL
jgi:hypothetical protein